MQDIFEAWCVAKKARFHSIFLVFRFFLMRVSEIRALLIGFFSDEVTSGSIVTGNEVFHAIVRYRHTAADAGSGAPDDWDIVTAHLSRLAGIFIIVIVLYFGAPGVDGLSYRSGKVDLIDIILPAGVHLIAEIFPHGRQQLLSPGVYYVQAWDQAGQHGATRTRGHTFALLVTDSVPWTYATYPPVHILEATNSTRDRDEDGTQDQFDWYRPARYPDVLSRWGRTCFAQLINPYALEKDDG